MSCGYILQRKSVATSVANHPYASSIAKLMIFRGYGERNPYQVCRKGELKIHEMEFRESLGVSCFRKISPYIYGKRESLIQYEITNGSILTGHKTDAMILQYSSI